APGALALQPAYHVPADAERALEPARQRGRDELPEGPRRLRGCGELLAQGIDERPVARRTLRGDPAERLTDHVVGAHRRAKDAARHVGDASPTILPRPLAPQCRGRAHELAVRSLEGLPTAPHEHGDVGTLTAAIRVELVEHEEPQPTRTLDELTLVRSRENQLQHHVVGEQD